MKSNNKDFNWFYRSDCRSNTSPFFSRKQNGGQQSKNENDKNNIENVFTKWSELQIIESRNKNPFYKNLYIDVLENIKSNDKVDNAYSHISTTRNNYYQNCCKNYRKIKELQISHNQHIDNFIDKLKTILNENKSENVDTDNVLNYLCYCKIFFKTNSKSYNHI